MTPQESITHAIRGAKSQGRPALVAYVTAGFPTRAGFVEQLNEVEVAGVEPMTSVIPMAMKKRQDAVTDGNKAADIVANAPQTDENFFLVPKVVE